MKTKKDAVSTELARLEKQEKRFLEKRMEKKESVLNRMLAEKVPDKLQNTLNAAFAKAFQLVFDSGTGLIELGCNKDEREIQFQIDRFAAGIRGDKKSLRVFSKKAGSAGALNLALSGAAGIGLGVLGIGLPDIALFTGLMLKSIYEIALSYGFEYETDSERNFILRLVSGATSYGDELCRVDSELNAFIECGVFPAEDNSAKLIKQAADGLSKELLYMKFLQGIPIVGAVVGVYDAVYMKRVTEYAELKYRRRFYSGLRTLHV